MALFASKLARLIAGLFRNLRTRVLTVIATLFMPAIQAGAIVMGAYRDSTSYSWKIMLKRHQVGSLFLAVGMALSIAIAAAYSSVLFSVDFHTAPMFAAMFFLALYIAAGVIAIIGAKIIAKLIECHLYSQLGSRDK